MPLRKARSQPSRNGLSSETSTPSLPPSDPNPSQLFILPSDASSAARFVSLVNPATSQLTRYLYCPDTGFYEFKQVGRPKSVPASFLLSQDGASNHEKPNLSQSPSTSGTNHEKYDENKNYILDGCSILIATPFDPLFLLTPLVPVGAINDRTDWPHLARLLEDYLETLAQSSKHLAQLLRRKGVRNLFEKRLKLIAQEQDIGVGVTYRLDALLLLNLLYEKAQRAVSKDVWPASLEREVLSQLETPATASTFDGASSQEKLSNPSQGYNKRDHQGHEADAQVEQVTGADGAQMHRDHSPQGTEPTPEGIVRKLRIRTALSFLLSSYIPPDLRGHLQSVIALNNFYDFSDLDGHLHRIEKLKQEAQALRSLSENVSYKRQGPDDHEAARARAKKRQKREDEENKRKSESRAMKDLKRTDISGMKKLSSFFAKKPI